MKRNVLILHGSSDLYGASKIMLITAKVLKEAGYNVFVVLSEDGPLVDKMREEQIMTFICRLGILRRKYFSPLGILNRLGVLFKARKKLIDLVNEHNIDVIYSNTTGVLVGALVAKNCQKKHVWHVHEIIESPIIFTRFIGKMLNQYSHKIIVVSNEVKKHWSKYVSDNEKLITIYNGLDYSEFIEPKPGLREELGIRDHEVVIGMIGRVNLWKGQGYFLDMAEVISRKYQNSRFIMAGDVYPGYEYLYDELERSILEKKLKGKVQVLGYRSDIPYILQGLDIFVLPSIKPDPLPTVVLEAMASAVPVVATGHGGAVEMVDTNSTGILIPSDQAVKGAEKIYTLISDAHLRREMGIQARKRVIDHFSLAQFKKNILKELEEL